jgi:L-aminopeptidase/D-esterase-like protein
LTETGSHNGLTDVGGILVGNYTDTEAASGVTVVLCPRGAVAGVDVRGSGPCTRETDLLSPQNLIQKIQAVVISGGSVFGLATADGVVQWLAQRGLGFPLDDQHVAPIVPAAALYDLGLGRQFVPPINADWGRLACEAASTGPIAGGCVGAATGATSAGIKSGLGTASQVMDSGITIAALVAVNPHGAIVNPYTGQIWEQGLEINDEFGESGKRAVKLPPMPDYRAGQNTTIGVIATDAAISKVHTFKIAQMAHDGMARAIRPAHTMFEGDTIFCISTGEKKLPKTSGSYMDPHALHLSELGHAAANCLSRAIIHGVISARSMAGMTAFDDLDDL